MSVGDSHLHTGGLDEQEAGWEAAAHIAAWHLDGRPYSSLRQLVRVRRALHPVRLHELELARTCMVSGQEGFDSDLFQEPLEDALSEDLN